MTCKALWAVSEITVYKETHYYYLEEGKLQTQTRLRGEWAPPGFICPWYATWNDSHFSAHTGSVIARVNKDRIFRCAPGLRWEVCWCKIRASRSNIIFGTWNVRTLRMTGKFEELTYETRRYGWNILGLSDVWRKTFDETSTLEGHKWYFSGKEENHEQVGIFCSKGHREHCHGLPSRLKQSYHHPPEYKSIEHQNYTDLYAPITDYDYDAVEDSLLCQAIGMPK